MVFSGYLREAYSNLITSKMRSFLTILGVLVGTASVVALVSGGQLATEQALAQFKTLGTDLLAVSIEDAKQEGGPAGGSGAGQQAQMKTLHLIDMAKIRNASPDILTAAPYTIGYGETSYKAKPLQANVLGAEETLKDVIKINVAKGRFVSFLDWQDYFCTIGSEVAVKMKQSGTVDPVGKQIRVGDNFFTVVGVVKPWPENMFIYADINHSIIVPIETSMLLSKYTKIRNIIFRLQPNSDIVAIQNRITNVINKILPGKRLFFRSAKELIVSMEKQRHTLTLFLALIGSISLVVGGIGVMNIMLVSVIERKREIGVRMAIGARRRDIQFMFLTEAIVLTLFGGLVGISIGELISFFTALFSGWSFHFYVMPPLAGFLVSVMVGIFFGFYPAYQASRLDPITTLRSD